MNEDDQIMAANYSSMGSEFRAHRAGLWSKAHIAHFGGDLWSYDVMPDGRVAALIQDDVEQEQHAQNHIIFFENFFEHLKRVAPRQ